MRSFHCFFIMSYKNKLRLIDKSQFILITHNKETMKGSHRLYGVTMNKEIGETKIVAVDV